MNSKDFELPSTIASWSFQWYSQSQISNASPGVSNSFSATASKKVVNLGDPGWWQNGRPGCGAWGGGDGTVIYCAGVALYMIEVGTIEECFLHEG